MFLIFHFNLLNNLTFIKNIIYNNINNELNILQKYADNIEYIQML